MHSQWYLIGSDATRDGAIRVFRLGRMEAPEVGKAKSPEYEIRTTSTCRLRAPPAVGAGGRRAVHLASLMDGGGPGSTYRSVYVWSPFHLSLRQHVLDEEGRGVRISVRR